MRRITVYVLMIMLLVGILAGPGSALALTPPDVWPWAFDYGTWYNNVWYPDPNFYDYDTNPYRDYTQNLPDVEYEYNGVKYVIPASAAYDWMAGGKRVPYQTPDTLPVTEGIMVDVYVGRKLQLTSRMLGGLDPSNRSLLFRSSNTLVATVTDDGLVMGISAGMARIAVIDAYGIVYAKLDLVVDYAPVAPSIKLNKTKVSVRRNSQYQLQATSRGQVVNALWFSSDPNIATVDQGGWVTTYGEKGKVVITAMTGSGGAVKNCTITVK